MHRWFDKFFVWPLHGRRFAKKFCRKERRLPDPIGEVREEFTIDRASAQAYEVHKGETLQIIDVMGQQCSDFQAFRTDALDAGTEWMIDGTTTRSMVRPVFPVT